MRYRATALFVSTLLGLLTYMQYEPKTSTQFQADRLSEPHSPVLPGTPDRSGSVDDGRYESRDIDQQSGSGNQPQPLTFARP